MKTLPALILAAPLAASGADFSYYASTQNSYSCTGFSMATCTGFELSDPTHRIDSISIRVYSKNPLVLKIKAWIDDTPYQAVVPATQTGSQFAAGDTVGAGTAIKMSVNWFMARHCIPSGACADRYLAESGTVSN